MRGSRNSGENADCFFLDEEAFVIGSGRGPVALHHQFVPVSQACLLFQSSGSRKPNASWTSAG